MRSVTSVCNMALGYLNHPPLSSLDEEGRPEAELLRRIFPDVRDRVLGEHPWSFATRREPLAELSQDSPYPDCSKAYGLPHSCLRVLDVGDGSRYIREGGRIYTSHPRPSIEYVKRVEEMDDWPPKVISALCCLLAAEMALPLSGDANLFNAMYNRFRMEIDSAKSEDYIENFHASQPDGTPGGFLSSRFGGL